MRILQRAILRELVFAFAIGLVSLNMVLMMEKVLKLTRLLSSVGASPLDMLVMVLLIQPALFILTTPMAFLIAVLVTYGRLGMDGELTAMRSCGMSLGEITRPVLLMGVACFFAAGLSGFFVAPWGARHLRETVSRVLSERAHLAVEEGAFNMPATGVILYVQGKPAKNTLEGVFVYDGRGDSPMALAARSGRLSAGPSGVSLELKDGLVHFVKGARTTELFFEEYDFALPFAFEEPARKKAEMTPAELIRAAAQTAGKKQKTMYRLEFWRRFSFPALCLILIYLGPALSLISGRSGRLGGLVIGLAVFVAYHGALLYGEKLSEAGNIPHWLGAWGPALLLSMASAIAWRKASLR